jgi:aspartate racemase
MHKLADYITSAVSLPFIHIADATAQRIKAAGMDTVGLLGTRFTMEDDFYAGRLRDKFGLNVLVPDENGRTQVHDIIYNELVFGDIRDASRQVYIAEIARMEERGAQGVILGCTEIGLLIKPEHSPILTFDTTQIHAEAAAAFAIGEPEVE